MLGFTSVNKICYQPIDKRKKIITRKWWKTKVIQY